MSDIEPFVEFAEELADAARAVALRFDCNEVAIEDKSRGGDYDPVTRADREIETVMRGLIESRWPEHGIEGEEFKSRPARGPYAWSLDPIDGTRSFICGLPTWTILIALLEEGQPVVGVIDAPRLGERFIGCGANGRLVTASRVDRLMTSGCRALREARLSTTDPFLFSPDQRKQFERVQRSARLTRYGLDGYAYARLAAGGLDLVIESGLAPHDLNALIPVVVGAGGAISDWSGKADFSKGEVVAAASAELLDEAVGQLFQ
jgi:histidinol phosphatase-like enzyme (inositol monophosphatase family)